MRQCKSCNELISGQGRQYCEPCSKRRRDELRVKNRRYDSTICDVCGKEYRRIHRAHKRGKQNCCSDQCAAKIAHIYRSYQAKESHKNGGKLIGRGGYVYIWIPLDDPLYCMCSHRNRKRLDGTPIPGDYLPEHRLVMARRLGRPLLKSEPVHHKNGIKSDNRIENLELVTPQSHNLRTMLCSHCELRKEIRLLQEQIKELTTQLQSGLIPNMKYVPRVPENPQS